MKQVLTTSMILLKRKFLMHSITRVRDKRPRAYWAPNTGTTVTIKSILSDDTALSPIQFKRTRTRCMLRKHMEDVIQDFFLFCCLDKRAMRPSEHGKTLPSLSTEFLYKCRRRPGARQPVRKSSDPEPTSLAHQCR